MCARMWLLRNFVEFSTRPRFPRINPDERVSDISENRTRSSERAFHVLCGAQTGEPACSMAIRYNSIGRPVRGGSRNRERKRVPESGLAASFGCGASRHGVSFPSPFLFFSSLARRVHNAAVLAPLVAALITPCMHNKEKLWTDDTRRAACVVCQIALDTRRLRMTRDTNGAASEIPMPRVSPFSVFPRRGESE